MTCIEITILVLYKSANCDENVEYTSTPSPPKTLVENRTR